MLVLDVPVGLWLSLPLFWWGEGTPEPFLPFLILLPRVAF
jgi:hypothetical protein